MAHIDRIEQLFGVVIIAYTWAYLVGIAANIKVKAIRVLNNGRHAISIVKYGLNFIAEPSSVLSDQQKSMCLNFCHVLS